MWTYEHRIQGLETEMAQKDTETERLMALLEQA